MTTTIDMDKLMRIRTYEILHEIQTVRQALTGMTDQYAQGLLTARLSRLLSEAYRLGIDIESSEIESSEATK